LWQEDLQYNCVIGDQSEGKTSHFTIKEKFHEHFRKSYDFDVAAFKKVIIVRKSVPEKLIVLEVLSEDRRKIDSYYVWALNESDSRTIVTGFMSYAPLWAPKSNEEQVRATYQSMAPETEKRWKEAYIPRLRQKVESS
jgi:hypothetical protein